MVFTLIVILLIILMVIFVLAFVGKNKVERRSTRTNNNYTSGVGRRGADHVNNMLLQELPSKKYKIFNNVTLQVDNSKIQIDNIIVSLQGVFIVQTKTWTGWIVGTPELEKWKQINKQTTYNYSNPIKVNQHYIKLLNKLLKIPVTNIFSVIVFSGVCEFRNKRIENVLYARELTNYIQSFQDIIMNQVEAKTIIENINKAI